MTLKSHLKCWLCKNVSLDLIWISGVLGTGWQCKKVFSEKILNKIRVKKLLLCKSGTFL